MSFAIFSACLTAIVISPAFTQAVTTVNTSRNRPFGSLLTDSGRAVMSNVASKECC